MDNCTGIMEFDSSMVERKILLLILPSVFPENSRSLEEIYYHPEHAYL